MPDSQPHPLLAAQMDRLKGTIVNGMPTHDRHGRPVSASGHIRQRLAAAIYWSRMYYATIGPEHALGFFLFNKMQDKEMLEETADRLLQACDHLGIQIIDERRDD
jgi:hypothetical protein